MKPLRMIPFMGKIKAPTPSVSQNLPFFHRSFRDSTEFLTEPVKTMNLLDKTLGIIFGKEYNVMKECLYAGYHYERGNLNTAYEHALAAVAQIPENSSPEMKFCAMMILAATDNDKSLDKVKEMIEQNKAYYLNHNMHAYLFRLKLNDGDKNAAKEWLKNYGDDNFAFYKIYRHFTSVRAHIVLGDYTNAILILQKLLNLSERYKRPLDVIETLILLSIAHWKTGRSGSSAAMEYLERAVTIAHEYNFTQIFANEGNELTNMLYKLQKRSVQKNYTTLPSGYVKTLHIAAIAMSKHSKGLTGGRIPENLSFTDKQKTVMRLLCEGNSRNEIASKMNLKPYTVKSHLELIYKKLDVANSVDAVLKIKELNFF
jgi:LuxR family maltose regulon positive regulatory protein